MNRFNVALSFLTLVASVPAHAAGQIDGTWKADTATAKLSTKPDVFVVKDGVYDCTSCTPPYKIAADGQPHPVAGRDYWDAAAVTVLDASTLEWKRFRKGVLVGTTKVAASNDGRMLTYTSVSADNASGKTTTSTSMSKRVGTAPVGGHAASGSWVAVNDGAQIAEENLTATITTSGKAVTLTLGTGEHYTAELGGPKVAFMGDKANAMVALTKAGGGFVETDYVGGKAVGTYTYMPVNATTMTLKAVNLKAGTTDEFTLRKQ
ncbi:hypothetical protein ASG11_05095 [Sphingomonas sp. Leaf357]|uniref:hypothetical protein n=1 Tax=Sphingomonas sp. Leaf357 TaxID=1736350 RepID=UPI0007004D90|nr:hypothetical protein [Sphingomonas sp. Leaf357]KQS03695.1 hypothetical protein ASG11_05095 [Sphingomonas sp. Leaf357]